MPVGPTPPRAYGWRNDVPCRLSATSRSSASPNTADRRRSGPTSRSSAPQCSSTAKSLVTPVDIFGRHSTFIESPYQEGMPAGRGDIMNDFLEALRVQRWDDHRYYHHSRIN